MSAYGTPSQLQAAPPSPAWHKIWHMQFQSISPFTSHSVWLAAKTFIDKPNNKMESKARIFIKSPFL